MPIWLPAMVAIFSINNYSLYKYTIRNNPSNVRSRKIFQIGFYIWLLLGLILMISGVVQGGNLILVSVFGLFWVIFHGFVGIKEFKKYN